MWFEGDETRIFGDLARAEQIVDKVTGKDGTVEKMEQKEQSERPPLLYDLTSLQRDANRRFGFSARRTLQAAQSLYEDKKAITYPRTSSRYLSGDLVPQLKPTAETLVPIGDYAAGARYVLGLDQLPLQRVVNDARVDDHHAIIPTDVEHDVDRYSPDERRIFDLVARRFLAGLPPGGALPAHRGRHCGRGGALPHARQDHARAGWRGVYGLESDLDKQAGKTADEDAGDESAELPKLEQGQSRQVRQGRVRGQADEAAAALHRGDAALRDGDRRQADRRRGAARGDEGFRARHSATRAETIEVLIRGSTSSVPARSSSRPRRACR
jgi:DNA topoisomerase-3